MIALPISNYAEPIDASDPCGEALDYDLTFLELEITARGKPGHELGGSIVAPEEPDWNKVDGLIRELGKKSKDLRIAVIAVRSALKLAGIEGFQHAIEGLAVYVEAFWSRLHPRPDTDDPDDEIVRVNALADLCDAEGLLAELRAAPLGDSRMSRLCTLHNWLDTQKAVSSPEDSPATDIGTLESAFKEATPDSLFRTNEDLKTAIATIARIDAAVRKQVAAVLAPDFKALDDTLRQMQKLVASYMPPEEQTAVPGTAAEGGKAGSYDIRDRNDVIGTIDRICRWYRLNEPSSPVPALLERVKRVVAKDFMSLLVELAPNGAAEFRLLAGLPPENSN